MAKPPEPEQLDLFTDYAALEQQWQSKQETLEKEKRRQKSVLFIQKSALLKGMNLEEGATGKDRNAQIGGHKAYNGRQENRGLSGHHTHHVSVTRPHMSMCDQAAQFSPFAALTGYDTAIKENSTADLTSGQI